MSWATLVTLIPGLTRAGLEIYREVDRTRDGRKEPTLNEALGKLNAVRARDAEARRLRNASRSASLAGSGGVAKAQVSPASSGGSEGRSVSERLDAEQRGSIDAIAREVARAKLPGELAQARAALAAALVINAWAESRLRPKASNLVGEQSIGLFQINRKAHPQHAMRDLLDPAYNARAMLEIVASQSNRFNRGLRAGATVAQLAGALAYWAERPKRREAAAEARAALAQEWFGTRANLPALGWSPRS